MAEKSNFGVGRDNLSPEPPETKPLAEPTFPGAIEILKESWQIFKRRWLIFLGVMLIPTILHYLAIFILVGAGFLIIPFVVGISPWIGVMLLVIIAIPLAVIIVLWGPLALLYAIKDSKEGIGVIESYRRAWPKIISYLWILILISLVILGVFLPFMIPAVIFGGGLLFLLGIPAIIFVIIFAVWFSLAVYILITEDTKGTKALVKSREYVRGKWWGVLWRFLFIMLFSAAIGFFIFTLNTILFLIHETTGRIIGGITGFILQLCVGPFGVLYGFLIYRNLKAFKEGKFPSKETSPKEPRLLAESDKTSLR